jgi:hypothetical protein
MESGSSESSGTIVCKVTPWFLLRAVAMLLMFSVFGYLFLKDGMVGYREKNRAYYSYKTFENAGTQAMAPDQSSARWQDYAATQTFDFPENMDLLPASTNPKTPWPDELRNFEALSRGRWHEQWITYSAREKLDAKQLEPLDEGKIQGQFIAFSVCLVLGIVALFFLLRTLRRSMAVDAEGLLTPTGRRVAFADITRIDLRQWKRKGLAFVFHGPDSPPRRARIDGMTYGGFKAEDGAPAEALMQRVLARFSGEILDYVEEDPAEEPKHTAVAAPDA